MSFPRYDKYKDSGIEWLGEVPEHWAVLPLKRDLDFLTSGSRGWADHYSEYGALFIRIGNLTRDSIWLDLADIQRVKIPDGSEGERTKVKHGDVLFSITAYLGSVAVVPEDLEPAYVSQHVALARLNGQYFLPEWVGYLTLSFVGKTYLEAQGYGGTKIQLSLDDVANFIMVVPTICEQSAIVAFLNHETAKIDALIAEQQKLIELLKEKRQAVISHAVTKGLDPDAPMKDSGIEWLGEVPEHWDIKPIKYAIEKIEAGTSVNSVDEPAGEDGFGVLKTSCVYLNKFDPLENKMVVEEEIDRLSCPLKAGALIVSRMNTPDLVGATGLVVIAPKNLYLPDRLWQVSLYDANPSYVYYWSQSALYRALIKAACSGTSSSMQNLGQDQFRAFIFPKPKYEEQSAIAAFLDQETAKLDALTAEAQRATELLKERRAALISAAVTGKIDVRGFAQTAQA